LGRRKTGVFIAILVTFALLIFGLGLYVKYLGNKSAQKKEDELLRDSLYKVAAMDLTVYWIGDLPEDLTFLLGRIKKIDAGTLSRDNMPMKSPEFHMKNYDEDGNLIGESVPVEYSKNLLIIVNKETNFTDEDLSVISDCVISNKVPILVMGGGAIKTIKGHFIQSTMGIEDVDSYTYSMEYGVTNHVLDNEKLKAGERQYSIEILRFIIDSFREETPDT